MELARANTSSQQIAKCQGSGTNNILSKGTPTSSTDWQRKRRGRGALHAGRDPAEKRLEQNSEGKKSGFEKQKWSLIFLDFRFSLPTCPMTNSISKSLLFWGGPSDKWTLAYCLGLYYFSMKSGEPRCGNRWQFEQVTKQNTETDKVT